MWRERERENMWTYAESLRAPTAVCDPAYCGGGGKHEDRDDNCPGRADHFRYCCGRGASGEALFIVEEAVSFVGGAAQRAVMSGCTVNCKGGFNVG